MNVIGWQNMILVDSNRFDSIEPFGRQFWREAARQFWRERSCHQRTISVETWTALLVDCHYDFPPFITGRLPHSYSMLALGLAIDLRAVCEFQIQEGCEFQIK
jgi:hypothetical protein